MNRLISLAVLTIFGITISGCAGVTVRTDRTKVVNGKTMNDPGIRYYEPAPFLLVYTDSKGGLKSDLIWLPDTTKVMTIRPYAILSSNDATFSFNQGVLTKAKSVADETAIPTAVLGALKTAAIASAAASLNAAKSEKTAEVPAPFLYRIEVNGNTVTLITGNRTPDKISITLSQPPTK